VYFRTGFHSPDRRQYSGSVMRSRISNFSSNVAGATGYPHLWPEDIHTSEQKRLISSEYTVAATFRLNRNTQASSSPKYQLSLLTFWREFDTRRMEMPQFHTTDESVRGFLLPDYLWRNKKKSRCCEVCCGFLCDGVIEFTIHPPKPMSVF